MFIFSQTAFSASLGEIIKEIIDTEKIDFDDPDSQKILSKQLIDSYSNNISLLLADSVVFSSQSDQSKLIFYAFWRDIPIADEERLYLIQNMLSSDTKISEGAGFLLGLSDEKKFYRNEESIIVGDLSGHIAIARATSHRPIEYEHYLYSFSPEQALGLLNKKKLNSDETRIFSLLQERFKQPQEKRLDLWINEISPNVITYLSRNEINSYFLKYIISSIWKEYGDEKTFKGNNLSLLELAEKHLTHKEISVFFRGFVEQGEKTLPDDVSKWISEVETAIRNTSSDETHSFALDSASSSDKVTSTIGIPRHTNEIYQEIERAFSNSQGEPLAFETMSSNAAISIREKYQGNTSSLAEDAISLLQSSEELYSHFLSLWPQIKLTDTERLHLLKSFVKGHEGAGQARFLLSLSDQKIDSGKYFPDISWHRELLKNSSEPPAEYVVYLLTQDADQAIKILKSDLTENERAIVRNFEQIKEIDHPSSRLAHWQNNGRPLVEKTVANANGNDVFFKYLLFSIGSLYRLPELAKHNNQAIVDSLSEFVGDDLTGILLKGRMIGQSQVPSSSPDIIEAWIREVENSSLAITPEGVGAKKVGVARTAVTRDEPSSPQSTELEQNQVDATALSAFQWIPFGIGIFAVALAVAIAIISKLRGKRQ